MEQRLGDFDNSRVTGKSFEQVRVGPRVFDFPKHRDLRITV